MDEVCQTEYFPQNASNIISAERAEKRGTSRCLWGAGCLGRIGTRRRDDAATEPVWLWPEPFLGFWWKRGIPQACKIVKK